MKNVSKPYMNKKDNRKIIRDDPKAPYLNKKKKKNNQLWNDDLQLPQLNEIVYKSQKN